MKMWSSIVFILSLLSIASGEFSSLGRNLLDLSRPECLVSGTSLNCLPTNNCEKGWTCVSAFQVDGFSWVGTYCYDPACLPSPPTAAPTNLATDDITDRGEDDDDETGSSGGINDVVEVTFCWQEACGTNTVCQGGLSCMSRDRSCFCRDPSVYKSDCTKVINGVLDETDATCETEFIDNSWVVSTTTPSPTASPTASPTESPTTSPTASPTASPTSPPTSPPTVAQSPRPTLKSKGKKAKKGTKVTLPSTPLPTSKGKKAKKGNEVRNLHE